jgi:hypothetical protein
MNPIPIYLKTDADLPRPVEPEFYLITADGTYLCRNHPFFISDVPARQAPRSLLPHQASCSVRFPKLGTAGLEYVVGFFDRIHQEHGAESIAILLWDQRRRRYRIHVPKQEATVWEATGGRRTALDVSYELPLPLPRDHLLVADIHCHCDFSADASYTDRRDERFRDGVHAIVGEIDREPPQFRLELSIDGARFLMRFDQLFRGYRQRRNCVPEAWLKSVSVQTKRPQPRNDFRPADRHNASWSKGWKA